MQTKDIPLLSGGTRWYGHLRELRDDRFGLFDRLNEECGDIGRIRAFGADLIFANSPDLLHDVLVEKSKSFGKPPVIRGALRALAGDGLFTSEGELWKSQRKLMAPLFTAAKVGGYVEMMAECAADEVSRLEAGPLDITQVTTRIAMRIAGKTLFDDEMTEGRDELGQALTVALQWANDVAGSSSYVGQLHLSASARALTHRLPPRLQSAGYRVSEAVLTPIRWPGEQTRTVTKALALVDRLVGRMIEERRRSRATLSVRNDLLSLLLAARDDKGAPMSEKQVRDEIVTLFVAGHETTAAALAWALYLLASHPEAYERTKVEARAFAKATEGRKITARDMKQLSFGLSVFKEAMRLYPPVYFFGRQAKQNVRIGQYDLERDQVVFISTYAMHRRPEVWPNPHQFDPSRFTPAKEEARHRQAYLPFSAGPRSCIGNSFALLEGPLVLAILLSRVDLELASSRPVLTDTSATLRPKGGIRMRLVNVESDPRNAGAVTGKLPSPARQ